MVLVILYYLFNKINQKENFVRTQTSSHSSKVGVIKPIQVSSYYKSPQKTSQTFFERDNWITNPTNSPNISPKLIDSSTNSVVSSGNFEDSTKSLNSVLNKNQSNDRNLKMILEENSKYNYKGLRPTAGHLIRPIEIDSNPSSKTLVEKPYLTTETVLANSEYLDYASVPNELKYNSVIFQEGLSENQPQNLGNITNSPDYNAKSSSYNTEIAKKLIKKAAQLSVISTQTDDPVVSVQKANYAIGYFDALQDIMSETEIKNLVNIDLEKFTKELVNIQNFNITNMKMKCPSLSEDKKYLLNIATNL